MIPVFYFHTSKSLRIQYEQLKQISNWLTVVQTNYHQMSLNRTSCYFTHPKKTSRNGHTNKWANNSLKTKYLRLLEFYQNYAINVP